MANMEETFGKKARKISNPPGHKGNTHDGMGKTMN